MALSRSSFVSSDGSIIRHARCIREISVPLWTPPATDLPGKEGKNQPAPSVVEPIITADGNYIIMDRPPGQLLAYDIVAKCELRLSSGHRGAILCLAMMSDNKHFVSGGEDKEVRCTCIVADIDGKWW